MSADNGIYIAKFYDGEHRVIHAMAIENLTWNQDGSDSFNPEAIYDYYKNAESMTQEQARTKAFTMADEILSDEFCSILEYGISTIKIPFTWQEILIALDDCKCGKKKHTKTTTCTECYFEPKSLCGYCWKLKRECICEAKEEI